MDDLFLPDKSTASIQNLLDIHASYGIPTRLIDNVEDSPSLKLLNLLKKIDRANDELIKVDMLIKKSQLEQFNMSLKPEQAFESQYVQMVSSLERNLKFLIDKKQKIIETLENPLMDESIVLEMGLEHQKQACDCLKNAKSEMTEMATQLTFLKDFSSILDQSVLIASQMEKSEKLGSLVMKLRQEADQLSEFLTANNNKFQKS